MKEINEVLRTAKKLKYNIKQQGNNHYCIAGNNRKFTVSCTPRSATTIKAIHNQIIRLGVNCERYI